MVKTLIVILSSNLNLSSFLKFLNLLKFPNRLNKKSAGEQHYAVPPLQRTPMYSHGESNPNRWNRNPLFYPLNYGSFLVFPTAKVMVFFHYTNK